VKDGNEGVTQVEVTNVDDMAAPVRELAADVNKLGGQLAEVEGLVGSEDVETRVDAAIQSNNETQQSELDVKLAENQASELEVLKSTAADFARQEVADIQVQLDILENLRENLEGAGEKQDELQQQVDAKLKAVTGELEKASEREALVTTRLLAEENARKEANLQIETNVEKARREIDRMIKEDLPKIKGDVARADENAKQALHKAPRP